MERKDEIKVAARSGIGFGIILAMMLVRSVLSVIKVNAICNSLQHVSEVNNLKLRYAINFRGSIRDRTIALRDVALVGDTELTMSASRNGKTSFFAGGGHVRATFAQSPAPAGA